MKLMWDLYLPAAFAAMMIGAAFGWRAFPFSRPRWSRVALGALAACAVMSLWHGPIGAAGRFQKAAEDVTVRTLAYYEMTKVTAHLEEGPLTRRMLLAGPADGFQRSELVRIVGQVPGVASVAWTDQGEARAYRIPLLAETLIFALIAFAIGTIFAYLIELRRRATRYDRF